ncbi:MAG: regulatory protein RecX, partial [Saprospiraceae bacterium]|nr:regulatory protein RecX [Saprospiraceae bacterium]
SEKIQVLERLQKYCAYQERCHSEVRNKLLNMKVYGDDLEEIISQLVQENFLNEERFARSFARGKFRMKRWGRYRIKLELKRRDISEYCINKAMSEIDEQDYLSTLDDLVEKLIGEYQHLSPAERRQKITQRLGRRGFEFGLISQSLEKFRIP